MSDRIYYGAAVENDVFDVDADANEEQPENEQDEQVQNLLTSEQQLYLQELAGRQHRLAIPTLDTVVIQWLRAAAQPKTLFGEGPYERRERLRKILVADSQLDASIRRTLGLHSLHADDQQHGQEGEPADTEEFYVPGSAELLHTRRWLASFAKKRAAARLEMERSLKIKGAKTVKEERLAVHRMAAAFTLESSQLAGERPISACIFSPTNQHVVTGDFSGAIKWWSTQNCKLLGISSFTNASNKSTHQSRIGALCFEDSGMMASCDLQGAIALWPRDQEFAASDSLTAASCEPVAWLKGHTARVARVAFHPSGRLLASASFDYSWRLWDVERLIELQLQEGHSQPVYTVAFHRDGALAATGGLDSHGRVWDLRLGKAIWTLQGHIQPILSIDFDPLTPRIVSGSEDGTVRLWDLRKLAPITILPAHTSAVTVSRFVNEHGDLLMSAGFDGLLRLWGSHDYNPLNALTGHESKVLSADFGTKSIVTAGADRTFKLWNSKC